MTTISKNKCCACQGFNRIAAIALLFLNEEDAFWLMVYIIDVVMPSNYYTKQLLGAQVEIQFQFFIFNCDSNTVM